MKTLTHFICAVSFALLICLTSCKSDDSVSPDSQLEIITLETSNAYKGDYLDEIVTIKVTSPIPHEELRVSGRQVDGSGFVVGLEFPHTSFFGVRVDENYEVRLLLSLGCEELQTFRFSLIRTNQDITDLNEIASLEVEINAADHPSGWRRICGAPSLELISESNGQAFIAENYTESPGDPYKSRLSFSSDYLSWADYGEVDSYVYDFNITNNNVLHVLSLTGVQSSTDGSNWQTWPTNGLPLDGEFVSPISMLAEDSVVFVTYSDNSSITTNTYRSRDQGSTWEVLPSEGLVYSRLSNGNLITLTEQNGIFISEDSGTSWETLTANSPAGFIKSYYVVSESELVILETEEFGTDKTIYRFDINSQQYTELMSTEQAIREIRVVNDVVYALGTESIFKITGTTEVIAGPDFDPSQTIFDPFIKTFGRLLVTGTDQFVVADGTFTYTNF